MEFRVLRYFLAVAREGSISKAAAVLFITQPTLSRQLMDLEEELGKKLFIRNKKGLILTEEGLLLRKRAEEIIELIEKAETEITNPNEDIYGDIYIGSGETDAIRFLAKIAKKLGEEYPRIKYHLFSGDAEEVKEKLDKGLLDFGILIGSTDIKKYEYIKLEAKDTWGVLMRKDSFLATKNTIEPKDLEDIPLLCSKQSRVKDVISEWLGKDLDQLNVVGTYNLIYNASIIVEENLGYALSLDKLINTSGKSPLCFRPLEPKLEVGLNIIWKKSQVFSKAAKKFLEKLQLEFRDSDNIK